jgi:hypothetical protein
MRVTAYEGAAYTCGAWELALQAAHDANAHSGYLYAWNGGFAWRFSDTSSGWVDVYDGQDELTEYSSGTVGATRAVRPADHPEFVAARDAAATRPRCAVLGSAGDALVHGVWTLALSADGRSVSAMVAAKDTVVYAFKLDKPGFKHFFEGQLVSTVTLAAAAGPAVAACAPAAAPAAADAAQRAAAVEAAAAEQRRIGTAGAVPADLAAWLAPLALAHYGSALCATLGVASLADVVYATDAHLQSIAMLPVQRAKFLSHARKLRPRKRRRTSL